MAPSTHNISPCYTSAIPQVNPNMVTLKQINSEFAAAFKAVRLNALQDTPFAFGSTFAKESQFSDREWEQRMSRWNGDRSICYLAWDGDIPCGIAAGLLDEEQSTRVHLVSMWVAPAHRRSGVGSPALRRLEARSPAG